MALKLAGNNFNSSIENSNSFGNHTIMDKLITNLSIDQYGSNYPKEVFDPHGFPAEGFYDELAADIKRKLDERRPEREFVSSKYQVEGVRGVSEVKK
jgi:hypothetical protein